MIRLQKEDIDWSVNVELPEDFFVDIIVKIEK